MADSRVENKPIAVAMALAQNIDPTNDYGVFYSETGNGNSWTWYVNAPSWKVAISDIFAEMPSWADIAPITINTYIVADTNGYFRKWRIVRLSNQ